MCCHPTIGFGRGERKGGGGGVFYAWVQLVAVPFIKSTTVRKENGDRFFLLLRVTMRKN
jgi:hypothetical protein